MPSCCQTIIEALKYVTTGTLPPLSDGGKSFIHDPALESQSLTRAQIRLTFRTNGDEQAVLAVRSFQLTQTNKTRSFKALESVLKVKQLTGPTSGTERSISNKSLTQHTSPATNLTHHGIEPDLEHLP